MSLHLEQGFSASAPRRSGRIVLCCGSCSVHCGTFSSIPGLHSRGASSPHPLGCDHQHPQTCQICPRGKSHPPPPVCDGCAKSILLSTWSKSLLLRYAGGSRVRKMGTRRSVPGQMFLPPHIPVGSLTYRGDSVSQMGFCLSRSLRAHTHRRICPFL